MHKILIIVGPTASGKSALAVELAKRFNGEIISADSRQVYKGLDIGTGKVTKAEMQNIPHYLLDIVSPRTRFTAQDFVTHAKQAMQAIIQKGKLPIVVGGTGFYIDALTSRVFLPDVPPDSKFRTLMEKKTVEQLFALLEKKDPRRAKMMSTPSERNNKLRLIRALEVASAKKTPPVKKIEIAMNPLWIGIQPAESELQKKIQIRLVARLKRGMIKEAEHLHTKGISYKRMHELGLEYRSLARFLEGIITRKELTKELTSDIYQYAKRQMTYWRRNKDIVWFSPSEGIELLQTVEKLLKD
ncbi:MAG: miaA [Candidatus Kaiserbacteria bacterium]|nr:miaA [Candidatus Kaiserbacteria bacterium]